MNINFKPPQFKLFPYEKNFLCWEISKLSRGTAEVDLSSNILKITGDDSCTIEKIVKRSTFIDEIQLKEDNIKTNQSMLELGSMQGKKKQSTRYLTHGIHEYRGKFNPQAARSILNILNIEPGNLLLDPFCGSGTTLLEASRLGIEAVGYDINPLAVQISRAKFSALRINQKEFIRNIEYAVSFSLKENIVRIDDTARNTYLKSWIPENILQFLENYKRCCSRFDYPEVYLTLASNLIRDYSHQEPSDLRIRRRRISPFPDKELGVALLESAGALSKQITFFSQTEDISFLPDAISEVQDIREYKAQKITFDAALTSPPYATALPYIDTHRISMVWLDLISPAEIRPLEERLLGSREISKSEQILFFEDMEKYQSILPKHEILLCAKLASALNKHDGFRRQAVPALLLRYFYDMHRALKNILSMMNQNAPFALIVGSNKTTLGGTEFKIDTPGHIVSLAENVGWKVKESIPLQTYQRYGLHSKNSINSESLLILESP